MLKSRESSPERKLDSTTTQADSSRGLDVTQQMQRMHETGSPSGSRRESFDGEHKRQQKPHDFRRIATSLAEQQRHLDDLQHKAGKSRDMSQGHDDIPMEPVRARRDSISSHSSDEGQHNQFEHLSLLEEGRANEINDRLANMEGHLNRLTGTVDQMNHLVQELRNQTRSRWDVPDRISNSFFSVTGGAASLIGLGYTLKAYYG